MNTLLSIDTLPDRPKCDSAAAAGGGSFLLVNYFLQLRAEQQFRCRDQARYGASTVCSPKTINFEGSLSSGVPGTYFPVCAITSIIRFQIRA